MAQFLKFKFLTIFKLNFNGGQFYLKNKFWLLQKFIIVWFYLINETNLSIWVSLKVDICLVVENTLLETGWMDGWVDGWVEKPGKGLLTAIKKKSL